MEFASYSIDVSKGFPARFPAGGDVEQTKRDLNKSFPKGSREIKSYQLEATVAETRTARVKQRGRD
jgi:hypothetical protein